MAATPIKFVAYYRVSTKKQGASGLGQDAQQAAARRHAELAGGSIVAEYTEVESGRKSNRQELKNALAHCRAAKATLLVAKLDRLARNVHFTSSLMESKVPFICADNPHAKDALATIEGGWVGGWLRLGVMAPFRARHLLLCFFI